MKRGLPISYEEYRDYTVSHSKRLLDTEQELQEKEIREQQRLNNDNSYKRSTNYKHETDPRVSELFEDD